jgi:hypothetical protein
MKRIVFIFALMAVALGSKAQSEGYQQQMESLLAKLDKAKVAGHYQALSNDFIRIANAEKSQWLPYYYAALCNVRIAYLYQEAPEKIEPFRALAESQIAKAKNLLDKGDKTALAEVLIVQSMVNRSRVFISPMQNGPKYGKEAGRLLEEAKKTDPENPRVIYTEASVKYHTPKLWGGDKEAAKELLEVALPKFATDTKDNLMPRWGKADCELLLNEYKKSQG